MNKMIPSEVINVDENGNAVIGTAKLKGGLEVIHTYNLDNYTFSVFFERHKENSTTYIFFGYFTYDGTDVPCMGEYAITGGKIAEFSAIGYDSIYKWVEGGNLEEKAIATNP